MPNTTLSTGTIWLQDGARFRPKVIRAMNLTSLVTGTTSASAVYESHRYRALRLYYTADGISTDSTVTVYVQSGNSTAPADLILTSSKAAGITLSATGSGTRVFPGLGRYTQVLVSNLGNGECTGLAIDGELI